MDPFFPTSYSTLDPSALAAIFIAQYGFAGAECTFMVRGVGDTYLVKTPGSRFIFRIYRSSHRTVSDIEGEITLLTTLNEAGVSVSYPLADKTGKMIQSFNAAEGTRYGVLFTFAEGISVAILNQQQLRNLGSEMARFHTISAAIQLETERWVFDLDTTLFHPIEAVKDAFAEDKESYTWLQEAAAHIQKKLAGFDLSTFSTGYCHFDFLSKNFHFDKKDKITFFDFDFFGRGWLIYDLMIFWQQLCMDTSFNRMTQEEADNSFAVFLAAYRAHRPVSEEELAAMPYLGLCFWLFYMQFHTTHDQFYPVIFQPGPLKTRMAFIRKLTEKYWPH